MEFVKIDVLVEDSCLLFGGYCVKASYMKGSVLSPGAL